MAERRNIRRLVLAVLRAHGPLSDAELAWWMRVAMQQKESSTKRARWALAKDKAVRFARQVKVTESGRIQKKWEVAPCRAAQ